MGIPLLIAINPPKEVSKNIFKRKLIFKKTGKILYGLNDPHITLFVNSFPNFSDVEKKVKSVVKKYKSFYAKIEGLYTFPFDPIHQANTIVYKIERTPTLAKLQKDIVMKLNPIRTNDQAKWLLKYNPNQSKNSLDNIKKYGYPIGLKDWIFHATIDSVKDKHYKIIWKQIQRYNLNKTWHVKNISIFIKLGDDGYKLFKKYKL